MFADSCNRLTALELLLNISSALALLRCHYCWPHMQMVVHTLVQWCSVAVADMQMSQCIGCHLPNQYNISGTFACADVESGVSVMQIMMTVNSVVLCYLCAPINPSKDAAACKVPLLLLAA